LKELKEKVGTDREWGNIIEGIYEVAREVVHKTSEMKVEQV
jgi:hypothetical protein